MRIVFWGSPAFALPSLAALLGEAFDVVSVVTQPTRPAGRGRVPRPPPVAVLAAAEGIPVLQPERADSPELLAALTALQPDLFVVVAYGQILKRSVLDAPRLGCINLHASLLPALRGAAPINWAIIRGLEETGVTVMRMVERMDAGPILLRIAEPIAADESAGDLHDRLSELSAEALIEALALLEAGELQEIEQDEALATFAPRLTREHRRLDWSLDAASLDRWIRGLDPAPGAFAELVGKEFQFFRPMPRNDQPHDALPGTILDASATDPQQGIAVACGTGVLHVRELQPPGKRRMTAAEWVRGRQRTVGARFL